MSHHDAPLNVREQIALDKEKTISNLQVLKEELDEVLLVSTCNRLAVYTYGQHYRPVIDFFNRFGDLNLYLNIYDYDDSAVNHLFSTAAGLKSQVIGEHQILGQVKQSYDLAKEANTMGPVMHELARRAIRAGKRVRGETSIGQHTTSIASVAYDLATKAYPDLIGTKVVILGTGEMSRLMLRMVAKTGVEELWVASRDRDRAAQVAKAYQAKPVVMSELGPVLEQADIIVGATDASQDFALTRKDLLPYTEDGNKLLIDMGLPRNFDPALSSLANVQLYDLDNIKEETYQSILKRQKEIPRAKGIIDEEVEDFLYWLNTKKVHPLIGSFYNQFDKIKERELNWALPKMGDLDEGQQKILDKFANRLISHMSKRPIETLKKYAQEPHGRSRPIDTFREIFNLKDVHIHIPKRRIVVGSRESKLALAQTNTVLDQLKQLEPDYEFVIKTIKTSGDLGFVQELGAWVKEVEHALLSEEIDLAVHSMKDVPTVSPEGTIIGGIPDRADHRDVLISKGGLKLDKLPEGAKVGTTSMRRGFQLREIRPDLQIVPVRGNIFTRMSKLEGEDYDAIVLAAAGLQRMSILHRMTEIFSVEQMVPAVGQGALAVQIRESDTKLRELVAKINHETTAQAVEAERAFLIALGGGCRLPMGAYGKVCGDLLTMEGMYANADGTKINRDRITGPAKDAAEIGKRLAEKLSKF